MRTINVSDNIIAINDLRRRFGEIEEALPFVDHFILTKKGKPFAVLSATPLVKRELMKSMAGAFKGSPLESDNVWKKILKRKSRKRNINL